MEIRSEFIEFSQALTDGHITDMAKRMLAELQLLVANDSKTVDKILHAWVFDS
jgi:hypothetical protein